MSQTNNDPYSGVQSGEASGPQTHLELDDR